MKNNTYTLKIKQADGVTNTYHFEDAEKRNRFLTLLRFHQLFNNS